MDQTNHFFNIGYGWLCKHCSAEDAERQIHPTTGPQAPADRKTNSQLSLASWKDESHQVLTCRRCGIEETISGSW